MSGCRRSPQIPAERCKLPEAIENLFRRNLANGYNKFRDRKISPKKRDASGQLQMSDTARKIAFIVASSAHGMLILNRLDYNTVGPMSYGVGIQTLENGSFDKTELDLTFNLIQLRRTC